MSLRVLSSRTVSIGDFDGSTGGGLTSVAPGILGVATRIRADATTSDRWRDLWSIKKDKSPLYNHIKELVLVHTAWSRKRSVAEVKDKITERS